MYTTSTTTNLTDGNLLKQSQAIHKNENTSTTLVNETNRDTTINNKTTIKSPLYYNITKDIDTYKPPNTPGAFIHIGKTGGSTISLLLRNGCHGFVRKPCKDLSERQPESYVSYLSTYYHVPDFINGKLLQHSQAVGYDFYVINIRDPMDRTISAYYDSHPDHFMVSKYTKFKSDHPESEMTFETYRTDNKRTMNTKSIHFKMYESYACFPTLQDFAMLVGHNHDNYTLTEKELETHKTDYALAAAAARDPTDNNRTCSNLARAMIHNQLDLTHMFWNYQTVMSLIDGWQDNNIKEKNKKAGIILVMRNEFKWDDWTNVNEWLGQEHGTVATYPGFAMRNRTNEFGVSTSRQLSEEARLYMCNALVEEYRIYFNLLEMAANLNETDVRMSHNKSRDSCPNLFDEYGSFLYSKR